MYAQKLNIILNQIEKTKNRVNEIFKRIVNGRDKQEVLNDLKRSNYVTDEQYEKLVIGPHTLPSISRIIQGLVFKKKMTLICLISLIISSEIYLIRVSS